MALNIGELTGYLNLDPSSFKDGVSEALGTLKGKDWKKAGAAAGVAAAGALAVGFKGAVDLRGANAKTAAQLNLTKDEAAKVGTVTGELYSKNLGGSMEEVSDGMGAVIGSFQSLRGASEAELAAAGEAALTFSKVMEVDVGAAATTAGTLVENGLAKDATGAFDLLSAAAQEVGPQMVEPLMDATNEYSKHFAMLGMDGEQTMSTLAAAAAGGEISIDKAGDAIKEFGIRATDLNDTGAQEALEALGLSGQDMANDLLAGGDRAQEATKTISEALLDVEDPAERAALAGGLFGTQIEDMGKDQLPGFLEALGGTGDAMGDVEGRTAEMGKTMSDGASGLEKFGRGVQVELIDMMTGAVDWLAKGTGGMDNLVKYTKPAVIALGAFAGVVGAASLALKIYNNWAAITKAASAIATAAQWAWNTALSANPIGLVIAGIAALVGGLYLFFTRTEKGREIWGVVWGFIKDTAASVADWFTGTLVPWLQGVWDSITAGAMWLWQNGIKPAWDGIQGAISAVVGWVTGTLVPALQAAWDGVASAAMWLWQNVMQPVWTGIKVAVAIAVTAVMTYIDLLKWYFDAVIAPVAMWLWKNVMQPVWQGIKTAIGAVVDWFQNTAWPALKAAWDAVAAAATWLWTGVMQPVWNGIKAAIAAVVGWFRDTAWPAVKRVIDWYAEGFKWLWRSVILPVWNGIKGAISAVVSWFQNTAWPLVQTVIGWLVTGFNRMRDSVKRAWQFVRDNVIAPVVTWLRDTAWGGIISPTLEALKRGFNVMRDSLSRAWGYVKNSIIAPVANWFRDTVKPLFDRSTGGIEDAFDTMKNAIKKAWNAIRDTAKKPVKFVVEKIINDAIIDNYNSVAKTFGLGTIDPVSLPSGWARGGILPGYTPMSAGDDRLTPMRSGEGVLVSEGLRDSASRQAFIGANEAAKRGKSFAEYVQGYAGGGIVLGKPFSGSAPRGDGFGARGGRHKGIDWPLPSGHALRAVAAGTARRTYNSAAGNKLDLNIGNGLVAGYHHLSRYAVGNGARVNGGATVGYVGSTGRSSGPHLHFSLKRDGKYVDPAPYLGAGGAAGSDGGGWNPFAGLWDGLKSRLREGVGSSPFGDVLYNMPKKLIDGALSWVGDKITALGDWGSEVAEGIGGRARWSGVMSKALGMKGEFGPMRLKWGLDRLMQESGGDPNAVNNWDSNAKKGTPSKGLMQVIDPTFRAYAEPGYSSNIFDPLSNILASINYTLARYGSLKKGWTRAGGYASGTVNASPGWHMVGEEGPELLRFRGGEQVLTAEETRRQLAGGNPGGLTDDEIERIATRMAEAVQSGSRKGVAEGLSGSAGRARTTARMGAL